MIKKAIRNRRNKEKQMQAYASCLKEKEQARKCNDYKGKHPKPSERVETSKDGWCAKKIPKQSEGDKAPASGKGNGLLQTSLENTGNSSRLENMSTVARKNRNKEKSCNFACNRGLLNKNNRDIKASKKKEESSTKALNVIKTDDIDKEILEKGTIKDKINMLSLIVARDHRRDDAFRQLLDLCENQRNEIVFYVLKNITELLLDGFFPLQKGRLKRIFEEQTRNKFIEDKVVNLLYKLVDGGILPKDLLYIFVNKLGSKNCSLVMARMEKVYERDREGVLEEFTRFYHKYEDLRGRSNVLRLLKKIGGRECLEFFKEVLNEIDPGQRDTRIQKMAEYCVKGLHKICFSAIKKTSIQTGRGCGSGKDVSKELLSGVDVQKLVLLCRMESTMTISLALLRILSQEMFREMLLESFENVSIKNQKALLNLVYNFVEKSEEDVFKRLLSMAFHANQEFLCGTVVLMRSLGIPFTHTGCLLKTHFSPVIRHLMEKGDFEFDPFDKDGFLRMEAASLEYLRNSE